LFSVADLRHWHFTR